jgi:hypothetical protein
MWWLYEEGIADMVEVYSWNGYAGLCVETIYARGSKAFSRGMRIFRKRDQRAWSP